MTALNAKTVQDLTTLDSNVKAAAESALEATGGLLRLAPNWVPRSFLQPGANLSATGRRCCVRVP